MSDESLDPLVMAKLGQILVPYGSSMFFLAAYKALTADKGTGGNIYIIDAAPTIGYGAFAEDVEVLEGMYLPRPDKNTLMPTFFHNVDSFKKYLVNRLETEKSVPKEKKVDVHFCKSCKSEKLFMGGFCTVCGK